MTELQTYVLYYFIVIFTSILVSISVKISEKKSRKIIFLIALMVPAIISAFRFDVGTDYFNYLNIYYELTGSGDLSYHLENSRLEPGWIILNYIVKYIFDDATYLIIISSLLIWFLSFTSLYQNRNHINMGIAVFILLVTMYNPSFNLIRLYMAASLILLSIKPIINKQIWKFVIFVFLAGMFHYSSLIFIVVYWIVNSKYRVIGSIKQGIALVSTILFVIFAEYLLDIITQFELFSTYSRYDVQYEGLGLGVILLDIPIKLIILMNLNKLKNSGNPIYKVTVVYFLGIILSFMSYLVDYGGRVATYFELMQIFIMAAIIKIQNDKYMKFIYILIVVFYYLSLYTYNYVYHNSHETVPYMWLP